MENEKNDFFDYDTYVKGDGGKKGKNDKKSKHKKESKNPFKLSAETYAEQKEKKPKEPKKKQYKLASPETAAKPKAPKKKHQEREESIENIRRMFDEALDESKEELAEFADEQAVPDMPEANPVGTRRKLYFLLGIVISVLAIIGLVSVVNFSAGKIKEFAENTQQKTEFARFIYPIVICDPAPFNQTIKLRNDTMLTAAIWDIILYEDKSKYEADFDMIIVPELDVEQHATHLFGTGLSFEHQSILNASVQFYYDESIKSYRIPSNPKYFTYSPYIEEISRIGERYTLLVGYVSPTPAWLTLTSDDQPEPEKYVEYVVSMRGDEMTLVAIQASDREVESPHGL